METKKSFLSENFYIFITLYAISVFLSNDMFLPAIQSISDDLNSSVKSMQLAITSWGIGALFVQLFAGPISDTYGRKKAIIVAGVMTLLGTLGCIFAYDTTSFIVARFFEGFAAGAVGTVAISSILDYYDSKKVIFIMSGITNVMMLAPIAGPLIGAYILSLANWQYIFIIDIVMFAIALGALIFWMPETLRAENKAEWQGVFTPIKLMYNMSKDIPFLIYCVSGGCATFIFVMWITGGPVLLITNNNLNSSEYAIYQAPVLIAFVIGNILAAQFMKKLPLNKMLDYSHKLFLIVGIAVVIVSLTFDISLTGMLIGLSCIFFVVGLLNAPKMNYALLLPEKYIGTAATFFSFTGLAIGMVASVYATTFPGEPNSTPLTIAGIFAVLAFITAFITEFLLKRRKTPTEAGEAGSIAEHEEWLRRQHNYSVHTGDDNYDHSDHSTN